MDNFVTIFIKPASMKVPPKRKGNPPVTTTTTYVLGLNESPSQKEGKYSMKCKKCDSF